MALGGLEKGRGGPSGGRGGQEVLVVLSQGAAHRRQGDRAGAERLVQAVDRDGDQVVAGGQRGGVGGDPGGLLFGELGEHDVRRGQRDPAVGGQAVVGDAL